MNMNKTLATELGHSCKQAILDRTPQENEQRLHDLGVGRHLLIFDPLFKAMNADERQKLLTAIEFEMAVIKKTLKASAPH